MKNFKKLKVWQQGREIAIEVYKLSESLDRQQSYTFSSQITDHSGGTINTFKYCGRKW